MAKSRETHNKKETEKQRQQKKKEKEQKKEDRRTNPKAGNNLEDMLAYVDENGNLSSLPPDPNKKKSIKEEDITIGVAKQVPQPEKGPRVGIVTFFNTSKGYGFIKDQETQESIFVHMNGLIDPIKENNLVTFDVQMGQKGPNAVNVKIAR